MRVKFTEGPAALTVPDRPEPVARGEVVDLPDAQAKQLLEQGWEAVGAKRKAPAKNKRKAPAKNKRKAPAAATKTAPAEPAETPETGPENGGN